MVCLYKENSNFDNSAVLDEIQEARQLLGRENGQLAQGEPATEIINTGLENVSGNGHPKEWPTLGGRELQTSELDKCLLHYR